MSMNLAVKLISGMYTVLPIGRPGRAALTIAMVKSNSVFGAYLETSMRSPGCSLGSCTAPDLICLIV
jgi:hypothetical protein